jgi:hypothetical protein
VDRADGQHCAYRAHLQNMADIQIHKAKTVTRPRSDRCKCDSNKSQSPASRERRNPTPTKEWKNATFDTHTTKAALRDVGTDRKCRTQLITRDAVTQWRQTQTKQDTGRTQQQAHLLKTYCPAPAVAHKAIAPRQHNAVGRKYGALR